MACVTVDPETTFKVKVRGRRHTVAASRTASFYTLYNKCSSYVAYNAVIRIMTARQNKLRKDDVESVLSPAVLSI